MKKSLLFTLCSFIILFITLEAYPQAGTLDVSFGNSGIVSYDSGTGHDNASDIIVYDDTSILVCGIQMATGYVTSGVLQKFLPNGDIDLSWGTDGKVVFQHGEDTHVYTMLMQEDGQILVSGVVYVTVSDAEFFVSRFNPDGTFDNTFNGTGTWIGSYTTEEEVAETMILQNDGKIVLAGRTYSGAFSQYLFARVNTDGTLDTGFGTNGYTEIDASPQDERINGLGILSNGYIIGVGYGYVSSPWFGEFAKVVKLDPNGTPDATFGTNGVMIPSVFSDISIAWDCIIENDSIIISAKMYDASNNDNLAITKLGADGIADPNFGSSGIAILYVDPVTIGYDIELYGDGKLYICGTAGLGGMFDRDFFLTRYNYNGTIDNTFNGTGYVKTPIRPDWDEANGQAMAPDGKIVLAGFSSGLSTGTDNDRNLTRYHNDFQPAAFYADFSVDDTTVCAGSSASFIDESVGQVDTWEWTFEGGTPSTSTAQNPVITYSAVGTYDVTLKISGSGGLDSITRMDYIEAIGVPGQADMPSGITELCATYSTDYTTNPVQYASEYEWVVTPAEAGTMVGTATTATFESSDGWSGNYTIKVRATNDCDDGPWSGELQCELWFNPSIFWLEGDGAYCTGSPGAELLLDSSQVDIDYELYKDGTSTGNIVAGTGNPISFGYISDDGMYSAVGYNDNCSEDMNGSIWVHEILAPEQAATPLGPETACNNETSTFTTDPDPDVETYFWTLDPPGSGVLATAHDTAYIEWDDSFSGTASLSVHGTNNCGDGPESDALQITVNQAPAPEITGLTEVCSDEEYTYSTAYNAGNTYSWELSGGSITAGAGTHEITVLWGAPGYGWVKVTEETNDGCIETTDEYNVTIDECTGIVEKEEKILLIYPNPANDQINIEIPVADSDITIRIVNSIGEVMEVLHADGNSEVIRINTKTYHSGIYYIQLSNGTKAPLYGKFIINH